MIARTTRITLEVAVGLLAGVALLLGIAFWRLTTGPVELDFLTPRIEAALSDPQAGVTVDVGSTELSWSAAERTVDLHSRDVEIRGGDGGLAARLPDIVLRFSLRALVQGTLAPRSVEVKGARLRVIRTAEGGFAFGPWGDGTGRASPAPPDRSPETPSDAARADAQLPSAVESDVSRLLPTVIDHLMSRPSPDRPLSFLRRVSLVDSRVLVEDRRANRFWQAPVADIVLERSERGLEGEMNFELALGGRPLTADARFLYDRARDRIEVGADFDELRPGALATLAPQLGVFSESTMELSGSLSARFDLAGVTESMRLELAGGPGRLAIQGALESPLPVRGLDLGLDFERARERISLETLELRFGTEDAPGPILNARGDVTTGPQGLAGDLALDATVTARDVSAAELTRYWPLEAAPGGRRWVRENITGGLVDRAEMDLVLTLPPDQSDARIERLEGNFTYHDLEIHYLRPMPPVTGASGRTGFDAAGLRFAVERGAVGALEVRPDSRIDILGLDSGDEHMAIDLDVAGPLQASLALLDHEQLRLIRKLGIDPAETSGRSEATIAFRFPLVDKLTFDRISITAKAQLENAAIRRFLFGLDATEGDLALDLNNAGMTLRGPVRLGDVPLRIIWTERFETEAKTPTEVEVEIPEIDARA
ncbi:MAG TPA: DUF3971 domain-containing protein, partial [Kiloniellales bacterium]|nr:DUF3971 domain-containing protein [Kiloniellales bacterium]